MVLRGGVQNALGMGIAEYFAKDVGVLGIRPVDHDFHIFEFGIHGLGAAGAHLVHF